MRFIEHLYQFYSDNSQLILLPNINNQLIKAVSKSYYWNNLSLSGEAKNSIDIQKIENLNNSTYIKDILRLRFLAPEIIEKILNSNILNAVNVIYHPN